MSRPSFDDPFTAKLIAEQRRLLGYVLSLVPDVVDAEDILQNANAVLLRKKDEAKQVENFPAWACRIAYFEVLAYRKKLGRRKEIFYADDSLLEALAAEGIDDYGTQDDMLAALAQCEKRLADRDRSLLDQRYTSDLSIDQIAEQTGRTPGAIRQALYRVRNDLLKCIRRRLAATQEMP